ncbi:hypothetical protein U7S25_000630 [Providencia rettgeri]|nr:hypothetical protein [Providencia rettgeri]ELQ1456002.1 hypothetical protein [Providencia rettgeri]ELQ1458857.1 hypothetical protein [Providencia rettgeri]ELR5185172.1 hypothetical protein [Providencia rettgeri]EMB0750008.1 hypothetical protein [Providencia rettgeri]
MAHDKTIILQNNKSLGYFNKLIISKGNNSHFNNNKYKSDTSGTLAGSVHYVQNCIIPAGKHIPDDIQPRIISNRKTMFLFQPREFIAHNDDVKLFVFDKQKRIIFEAKMKNPNELTSTCEPIYANISPPQPHSNEVTIIVSNDKQLHQLDDPGYFNDIILNHDTVKIITSDGHYNSSFKVESDEKYSRKKIIFQCKSTYRFSVFFNGRNVELATGDELTLVNVDGTWFEINTENNCDQFLSKIDYIGNCWSIIVPSQFIKPNITLQFTHQDKKGDIEYIDIGAPNELLLHTIAIGMLTPYRDKFEFQQMHEYHQQYFQQVPLSRLTVTTYDPIYLTELMLHDGRLLVGIAPGDGGWHTGIMREYIAKSLIASGINFANYGFFNAGRDKASNMVTPQITVHTSIGKYENGLQVHGGSGGAGMATLDDTIRNEFSHEIGHNYGLGHYPGGFYGSVNAVPSQRNSTWGWDSHNNFFIPNFESATRNKPTYLENEGEGLFALPYKEHSLGHDAMAGGSPMYEKYNAFTLHTPHSLNQIQHFLESKAVFNVNSATGFSRWDEELQQMREYRHTTSKYIYSDVPIENGKDITEEQLINIFQFNKEAMIHCYNGRHAPNIIFPTPNNYPDYLITIDTSASYSITLHLNDTQKIIHNNEVLHYISDGREWIMHDDDALLKDLVPYKQGVKVITLLGLHDPENKLPSYIYPALNGSYGMVYPDDSNKLDTDLDYLEVSLITGRCLQFQLAPIQINRNEMNQFHVNIERSLHPVEARVIHNGSVITSRKINLGNDDLTFTINSN